MPEPRIPKLRPLPGRRVTAGAGELDLTIAALDAADMADHLESTAEAIRSAREAVTGIRHLLDDWCSGGGVAMVGGLLDMTRQALELVEVTAAEQAEELAADLRGCVREARTPLPGEDTHEEEAA